MIHVSIAKDDLFVYYLSESGVNNVRGNSMQLETEQTVSQQPHTSVAPSAGLLFILSAPSGTGKDTVINALKEQGMDFYVVPSVTTRSPRPGESEGNPYHFVEEEKFKQMVEADELLE